MANFLSRLRGTPRFSNNNLKKLNQPVEGLVRTIRKLRGTIPTQYQTVNAFINATPTERAALNRSIVNFINKYNKAIEKTSVFARPPNAQAPRPNAKPPPVPPRPNAKPPALPPRPNAAQTPNAAAIIQANQAINQAVNAAQQLTTQVANTTPRGRITNLTNLNTNAKINSAIKKISETNNNVNWSKVSANGLTNAQKKVLNGLRNPFYNANNGLESHPIVNANETGNTPAVAAARRLNNMTGRGRIENFNNSSLNTNEKINSAIKRIREIKPNVQWKNVKANGLSNAQRKVLLGLRSTFFGGPTL